jgi:hypothetical protein
VVRGPSVGGSSHGQAASRCKYSSTSVQDVSKSPQRLACGSRAGSCVDLHRDRLVGMAKDSHKYAREHISVDEQRGACVPRITNDRTHARGLVTPDGLPVESARISAVTTSEDLRLQVS